jgi:hypothetical protein
MKTWIQYLINFEAINTCNEWRVVCKSLQMMLQVDHYRDVFVSIDGISTIMTVLSGWVNCRVNFQIQYQLAFCLWICSFNEKSSSKINKYNVIPVLSDILSEAVKEKVKRRIFTTFRVNFNLFIISFLLFFCFINFLFKWWNQLNLTFSECFTIH